MAAVRAGLIDELKHEHSEIIEVLLRIKGLGAGTAHGREVLLAAKDRLLSHIKKEDDELYPALKKTAEGDEALKAQMEDFADEMERVSREASGFFEKYSGVVPADETSKKKEKSGIGALIEKIAPGRKKADEFVEDFNKLFSTVLSRIQKEENILYAAYERLSR